MCRPPRDYAVACKQPSPTECPSNPEVEPRVWFSNFKGPPRRSPTALDWEGM